MRVLLIDDDPEMLFLVDYILKEAAIEIKTIDSYDRIFSTIEEFKPHLILLDIILKGKDGRSICLDIKKLSQPPIVLFFSAFSASLKTFRRYEADGFIEKPFDIDYFLDIIKTHKSSLSSTQ